jgi:DNA ligase (NAD+)
MNDEEKLINQLKEYDKLYYTDGSSPVDDMRYDELKDYAQKLYPNNPYFKQVGSPVSGEKVKLPFVMGSLNKVKIDNVKSWLDEQDDDEFVVTEKLDGSSIIINYKNGKVVFAATRGDGIYGKNITQKAKIFCKDVAEKSDTWVRAESMLIDNIHKKLGFKTARNGTAGILNRDYEKDSSKITPFFIEVINNDFTNEKEKMEFLSKFGRTPNYFIFNKKEHKISVLTAFLEMVKNNGSYEVDGLVITPMHYKREDVEFPINKVAFKMNEKPITVEVDHVEWEVSRTGRVVPVIHIKPTEIQGVLVSKATGFNAKFIMDEKIGTGSTVKIVRSGDVIPYITESITPYKTGVLIPHNCPSCGKGLTIKGVDLICKNPLCVSQSYKRVEHFLITMGAENITIKTLMKLGIDTIEKVYELDEFEIASQEGFGMKRARQIISEIEKTLQTTPDRFIRALGIPFVGKTFSKSVYDYFRPRCENDDHFMEIAFNLTPAELMKIDGVGEVTAEYYFKNIRQIGEGLLDFLKNKGLQWEQVARSLAGITFCMTGKGPYGRKEIQLMIEKKGGTVRSMSKSVDYLVANNKETQTGKAKKARQYGIPIINYDDLMEMLK